MKRPSWPVVLTLLLALSAAGCGRKQEERGGVPPSDIPAVRYPHAARTPDQQTRELLAFAEKQAEEGEKIATAEAEEGKAPKKTKPGEEPEEKQRPAKSSEEMLALGEKVFQRSCAACHRTGIAGAPKIGDRQAWAERIAKGMDTLIDHAVHGFRGMPPRGGDVSLSDEEVEAAVRYLLGKSR